MRHCKRNWPVLFVRFGPALGEMRRLDLAVNVRSGTRHHGAAGCCGVESRAWPYRGFCHGVSQSRGACGVEAVPALPRAGSPFCSCRGVCLRWRALNSAHARRVRGGQSRTCAVPRGGGGVQGACGWCAGWRRHSTLRMSQHRCWAVRSEAWGETAARGRVCVGRWAAGGRHAPRRRRRETAVLRGVGRRLRDSEGEKQGRARHLVAGADARGRAAAPAAAGVREPDVRAMARRLAGETRRAHAITRARCPCARCRPPCARIRGLPLAPRAQRLVRERRFGRACAAGTRRGRDLSARTRLTVRLRRGATRSALAMAGAGDGWRSPRARRAVAVGRPHVRRARRARTRTSPPPLRSGAPALLRVRNVAATGRVLREFFVPRSADAGPRALRPRTLRKPRRLVSSRAGALEARALRTTSHAASGLLSLLAARPQTIAPPARRGRLPSASVAPHSDHCSATRKPDAKPDAKSPQVAVPPCHRRHMPTDTPQPHTSSNVPTHPPFPATAPRRRSSKSRKSAPFRQLRTKTTIRHRRATLTVLRW